MRNESHTLRTTDYSHQKRASEIQETWRYLFICVGGRRVTTPVPIEIKRRDDGLLIRWSEDHEALYPAWDLRVACPCAECREEFTGRLMLDPDSVPHDIRPDRVELVGAYGFRIYWSDGHHTGIFTYGALFKSCPCARCRGERSGDVAAQ